VVNRGLALHAGLLFAPVIDGRLRALDAESGSIVWEARVAFPEDHYTITMAPRVAGDSVLIGVSGGERPARGFFDAYDVFTGHRRWRFHTVPGDPSQPFENEAMRMAAGTWDRDWWTRGGGGSVWDGMAYDAELGLVYVGTGNASPWTFQLRSSRDKDNLYVASILAVELETGVLRWHYQVVPGDNWDYDSVQQLVLADIRVLGRRRRVLMQANKNGFYYVIDRVTGQFLSAGPFAQVSWARGVHPRTGRPLVNEAAYYGTQAIRLAPGPAGAHNWAPMSFNPDTGLTYIPALTGSSFSYAAQPVYDPRRAFGIVLPPPPPQLPSPRSIGPQPVDGPGGSGALIAWDPVRRRIRWRQPGGSSFGGGTVTTASNLVFQTLNDGRLVAYTAHAGQPLLDLDTGLRNGIGPPITYRLDGRQYVAVMGGTFAPRLVTFAVEERHAAPRTVGVP
jgi:quinohemoprotein ethanol dehydrogenase